MKAVLVLTSAESKRLIAKGVATLPQIQAALADGRIVFAGGTTNAFVGEELLGIKIPDKGSHVMGLITDGVACGIPDARRMPFLVIEKGQRIVLPFAEALERLGPGDVFVKGANAIDPEGRVGILAGSAAGGTIGRATPYLGPDKAQLVLAVGLEKLIPSLPAAAAWATLDEVDAAFGWKNYVLPIAIPGQILVTEIEALQRLTGVRTTLLSAGGVGGSEGAVVLGVTGEPEEVQATLELVRSIKGEPPVTAVKLSCADCGRPCAMVK